MSNFLNYILMSLVVVALIFLGYNSLKSDILSIELSNQISSTNSPQQKLNYRIDEFLQIISGGLYKGYKKKEEQLKELTEKKQQKYQKSFLYLYYFSATIIIFGLIFFLLDYKILILFIAITSIISLTFGLLTPFLTLIVYKTLPVLGTITLSFETKSIIGTIEKLYHKENYFLSLLILIFSIVIPYIKSLTIALYIFFQEHKLNNKILVLVKKIGKWSMLDVFIVSILVVFFSTRQEINTFLKVETGLYFFTIYVLLSMLGSTLLCKNITKF